MCGSPLHDMEGGWDSSLKKGDVAVPRIKTEDRGHGGARMHRHIEVFLTSLSCVAPTLLLIHTDFRTAPPHVMQLFHVQPQKHRHPSSMRRGQRKQPSCWEVSLSGTSVTFSGSCENVREGVNGRKLGAYLFSD